MYFSKEHTWVRLEGNKAVIGITDYAQSELGDIVFVEFPSEGDTITQGEPFGTIESVKSVSDLHAPISGKVTAINEELEDAPETVNESPYEKGWIIEITPSDAKGEVSNLLNEDDYQHYIDTERNK